MRTIPLARPVLDRAAIEAAAKALEGERLVLGESVFRFEETLGRYLQADHVVTVSSGTHALHFALAALGLRRGEAVVTSPFSFVASGNAAIHAGGVPRFCDVDRGTYNMDPDRLAEALPADARFVVPVHLYGHPCAMDRILDVASRSRAVVVEDAAQAMGASFRDRKVGTFGRAGCFSFYPTKNLTVGGDGGAVATNDPAVADAVRKLRDCGRSGPYRHDAVGYTARLNTVNAAIGLEQVKHLDARNEERRERARMYADLLKDVEELRLPPAPTGHESPVYHLYVVQAERRDGLREALRRDGVETGVHYDVPIHLQPVYRERFGYGGGEFPVAEALAAKVLSLPLYPTLDPDDLRFVCERVRAFYGRA